jgi:hypothetical protein
MYVFSMLNFIKDCARAHYFLILFLEDCMMNKYFRSIALLIAAASIAVPAFAQGPFDATADWGPRSTVKTPGEVEYDAASGTFTLRGNGDDIWNNDDEAFYVYTTLTGSWRLSAKVYWDDPGTSEWSKVGVMMRETADNAASRNYMAILRGASFGDRADASWRATTGGSSSSAQMFEEDGTTPVQDIFFEGLYLRITRYAEIDVVQTEYSYDGVEWFVGHSQSMNFPDEIAWGLVITSHEDTAALVEATISDVVLEQVENIVAVNRAFDVTSFLPGQNINVTLNLFNPAEAKTVSLKETVPTGFTISNISGGGTASGNVITWNTNAASGASTLSYTVSVPASYNPSASGYSATFSGTDGTVDFQGKTNLFLINFGVGTELFSYDFEDATQVDDWTDLAGFFDIESGRLLELDDAGGPLVTLTGDSTLSDVAISVDATGLVGDADWGIVFRAIDLSNFYSWQFVNGNLELLEYVGGTRTTLYTEPFAEELNVAQNYLVVAKGTAFQLWFNGQLHAIVEDNSLTAGQVGLFTWVNAGTDLSTSIGGTAFDNFTVSSVAAASNVNNWSLY